MEVLACPLCDRLFHVTPAALGKKIRCRGCRGIFHVPKDTASVPLGPQENIPDPDRSLPPVARPCVIDGRDARSCPECGRTFRMQDSLAGKTIRCRGCKVTFRVTASQPLSAQSDHAEPAPSQAAAPGANQAAAASGQLHEPPPPASREPQPGPRPLIFEDIGDFLDDLLRPGEKVPSVVRPRHVPPVARVPFNPMAAVITVVAGGVCALPATLIILRIVSKNQFDAVASILPEFLVGWLR